LKQDVNYIKHHKAVNIKMMELKLNAVHISLYNALFLLWNQSGFQTDLSISRSQLMDLSKIGSANTYTSCLKELDKNKLIVYKPSHNPLIGSVVNLYRFDNSSDNSSDITTDNSSDNSSDTLHKLLNKETIKLINKESELINENLEKWIIQHKEGSDKKGKVFLFSNSKFNDYDTTRNYLAKQQKYIEKYRGVDLRHYIDEVDKWSDRSGKKTTDRGWIAYIREFMDKAIENNSLVKLEKGETRKEKIDRLYKEGNTKELMAMGLHVHF